VFEFEHMGLGGFFLDLGLKVVSLNFMLMKIIFDLTFDILNDSFFIVQI